MSGGTAELLVVLIGGLTIILSIAKYFFFRNEEMDGMQIPIAIASLAFLMALAPISGCEQTITKLDNVVIHKTEYDVVLVLKGEENRTLHSQNKYIIEHVNDTNIFCAIEKSNLYDITSYYYYFIKDSLGTIYKFDKYAR